MTGPFLVWGLGSVVWGCGGCWRRRAGGCSLLTGALCFPLPFAARGRIFLRILSRFDSGFPALVEHLSSTRPALFLRASSSFPALFLQTSRTRPAVFPQVFSRRLADAGRMHGAWMAVLSFLQRWAFCLNLPICQRTVLGGMAPFCAGVRGCATGGWKGAGPAALVRAGSGGRRVPGPWKEGVGFHGFSFRLWITVTVIRLQQKNGSILGLSRAVVCTAQAVVFVARAVVAIVVLYSLYNVFISIP